MNAIVVRRQLAQWRMWARDEQLALVTFAATLFVSALLLFSVQPMFAKLVLPKLGGSPSVWAVSMCFFQAVLLAGYGYAFVLNRWVEDKTAIVLHLALMALTCLALPFALPTSFSEPPQEEAYFWLLGLLTVGVGLPFFAVSANAPLLQAWFSRTGNRHARDPYFLYGASNLGSLIALLSYPVLIEPALGLGLQSQVWFAGFIVLGLLIAASGLTLLMRRPVRLSQNTAAEIAVEQDVIDWPRRLGWIGLSFLPSGLVIAVTTYITTDVASAPFLWVIPLALFLLTFVLVFRAEMPFNYNLVCEIVPALVLVVILTQSMLISSVFAILAFLLAAIICHRELYNRRPAPQHLTEFYFWMSAGGVLGGVFSALLAPHLFNSVFEFPLLILLALLCRPGIVFGRAVPIDWRRMAMIFAAGLSLMGAYKLAVWADLISTSRFYLFGLIGLLCAGLFVIRKWEEHRAALVFTMIAGAALSPADLYTLHVERSFFGTHRVIVTDDGSARLLLHGTTVHGAERLKDANGTPITAAQPATYYNAGGPMARGVAAARASVAAAGKPLNVGIVGLGAGSLACYSNKGENWRYFEIDPAVARIATDPKLFDFLSRCMPKSEIVIGDARLTVSKEAKDAFGYLVIDAFSSDSIPVHLLTKEALQLFVDKLAPDGLMAMHVSNRHLDLMPALASTIPLLPGVVAAFVDDKRTLDGLDAAPSQVVFLARKQAVLDRVLAWPDAHPMPASNVRAWTDDYSDVLSALVRKLRG